jgi:MFS family permease
MLTLTLLTAVSALTLNMIVPSLPAMARDLAARESAVGLVISGYMLGSALFQLSLGPVSDRLGRRPVMLAALCLYVLASLGCFLAQRSCSRRTRSTVAASGRSCWPMPNASRRTPWPWPASAAGRSSI